MKSFKYKAVFLFLLAFFSCTQSLDFSQLEDFKARPIYTSSLVHFTLTSQNFINPLTGNEISNLESHETDFRVFEEDFIRTNTFKMVLDLEISNEFDRKFTIDGEFLDASSNVVYKFSQLSILEKDSDFKHKEIIEIKESPEILKTGKVKIKISLLPSSNVLSISNPSLFSFKSSVTLFIETE